MKKKVSKMNFSKITIATINADITSKIKGGSSIPTEFDEKTFQEDCPTISV
jgi:hypothetical protein